MTVSSSVHWHMMRLYFNINIQPSNINDESKCILFCKGCFLAFYRAFPQKNILGANPQTPIVQCNTFGERENTFDFIGAVMYYAKASSVLLHFYICPPPPSRSVVYEACALWVKENSARLILFFLNAIIVKFAEAPL